HEGGAPERVRDRCPQRDVLRGLREGGQRDGRRVVGELRGPNGFEAGALGEPRGRDRVVDLGQRQDDPERTHREDFYPVHIACVMIFEIARRSRFPGRSTYLWWPTRRPDRRSCWSRWPR